MTVAKVARPETLVSYDEDVLLWSRQQARLLREGRFSELDVEHLADEIEDVGKSEKRELASRCAVLMAHLLKWRFQPSIRSSSWRATIRDQRKRIEWDPAVVQAAAAHDLALDANGFVAAKRFVDRAQR